MNSSPTPDQTSSSATIEGPSTSSPDLLDALIRQIARCPCGPEELAELDPHEPTACFRFAKDFQGRQFGDPYVLEHRGVVMTVSVEQGQPGDRKSIASVARFEEEGLLGFSVRLLDEAAVAQLEPLRPPKVFEQEVGPDEDETTDSLDVSRRFRIQLDLTRYSGQRSTSKKTIVAVAFSAGTSLHKYDDDKDRWTSDVDSAATVRVLTGFAKVRVSGRKKEVNTAQVSGRSFTLSWASSPDPIIRYHVIGGTYEER